MSPAPGLRWTLAAAALAAGILLRSWGSAERPLWLDESWSRWMTEQSWPGLLAAARLYDAHPPFYYALLKAWSALATAEPFGLRLLSILAGLAIVPIAWACARRAAPEAGWAPPFVAAAAALAPPLVVASRQTRPYALFALAFAAALWAALRLVRDDAMTPRRRAATWAVYLVATELLLWLHGLGILFSAALAGGLFLAFALEGRLRREWPAFLVVHALAAVAWIPAFLIILEQRRVWTSTWLRFAWADVPAGLASGLVAPGAAGGLLLAGALLGMFAMVRRREARGSAVLLAAAAFLPAAMTILLSVVSSPVFLPRTLVPSVLPVLLLLPAAIELLSLPRIRLAAGGAALAMLAGLSAALVARPPEERWDRLVAWLQPRVGPGEEVWLLPNELVLPLLYAGGSRPAPEVRQLPAPFPAAGHPAPRYSGTMAVPGMGAGDADRLVAEARRRGVTGIWVVSRFPRLFDPDASLGRALGGRPVSAERSFLPILVEHYRLRPAATPPPG